ncbi:hypothetical protein B9K09_22025 [Pseudomonas sp. M30-35]|nr:hypothetical protein B9K09_22025 [Pseudomonas sp. M30-35]
MITLKLLTIVLFTLLGSYRLVNANNLNSTNITADGGIVTFENAIKDTWQTVYYSNQSANKHQILKEHTSFATPDSDSLSANKKHLVINAINSGTLEYGKQKELYDRAYCIFVKMDTGCIVKKETGEFCGGYWDTTDSSWNLYGTLVNIANETCISP